MTGRKMVEKKAGYLAFAGKDKVDRLRIRRAMAPTRSPTYGALLDVMYDGEYGTNFVLLYTFMVVKVRGKNLQSLVLALETSTADFIQEYHPELWEQPANNDAIIESIEVVVKTGSENLAESETPEKKRH